MRWLWAAYALAVLYVMSVPSWAPIWPDRVPRVLKSLRRWLYCDRRWGHNRWMFGDGTARLERCWGCEHRVLPLPRLPDCVVDGTVRPVAMTPLGVQDCGPRRPVRILLFHQIAGEQLAVDVAVDRTVEFGPCPDATHYAYADSDGADLLYLDVLVDAGTDLTLKGHR